MDSKIFKNPPAENRIMPFWFWNGEMSDPEISFQIREMAEKGLGGFFVHPRQGMEIPYLSDLWFEKVRYAVKEAEKHGLQVWLYDEYPYPSGIGGGEVILQHPEAKHNNLIHKAVEVSGNEVLELELPFAKILSAKAVPVDSSCGSCMWEKAIDISGSAGSLQKSQIYQESGLTDYNSKRYFTNNPVKKLKWTAPAGKWKVVIFLEEEIHDFKYYGTYVDPCSEEAIRTFINITHEKYAEHLGEHFGKTVQGMFTDETGLLGIIPWSSRIPAYFKKMHGYDLVAHLPALTEPEYENAAKIRYDYMQAVHLLFRGAYHQQLGEWCDSHKIKYVTEVPSVRSTTQIYSHVPGGDTSHEKLGRSLKWVLDKYTASYRSNAKNVSALARQQGKRFAFIECFHSVGWSMTLQDAKWMIDKMGAMGINFYNFHAFFFSMNGLRKHDAPPSQFYQNPYWKHFKLLGDYTGRISYTMSTGNAVIDVAVLDPVTTLWTHMGNPFQRFSYAGKDAGEKKRMETLRQDWIDVCSTLLMNQRDYDPLDVEILENADVGSGRIVIGNASYSVLVLPPITNLEEKGWAKIKEFVSGGGTVIGIGSLPYQPINATPGLEQEILEWFGLSAQPQDNYWSTSGSPSGPALSKIHGKGSCVFIPCTGSFGSGGQGKELLQQLNVCCPAQFKLTPVTGNGNDFLTQLREMPDGSKVLFIANHEDGVHEAELSIGLPSDELFFEEMSLETGEISKLTAVKSESGWKLKLRFEPFSSQLLRIYSVPSAAFAAADAGELFPVKIDASQQWQMKALQDNILRLGNFKFALDSSNKGLELGWSNTPDTGSWPELSVKTVIAQCESLQRSHEYSLKFYQEFGTPLRTTIAYPLVTWNSTSFEVNEIPGEAYLLMDRGAISGDFTIYVNGKPIGIKDFNPHFRYDSGNIRCNIQPLLKSGINSLVVRVECAQDWDGLQDPLYITGSFGLSFDGKNPVLGRPAASSALHGGVYNSLPHYSGDISFKRSINLSGVPSAGNFKLDFSNFDPCFHDCAEVIINGVSLGVRAWLPYSWTGAAKLLKLGENEVEVKVSNTLINMLEGKYFDYVEHKTKDVVK